MDVAYEDLWNTAAAAERQHFRARLGSRINIDFLERHAFALKQAPRAAAVRAPFGRVHDYFRLGHVRQTAVDSTLGDRQVVGAPGGQTAAQTEHFRETLRDQLAHGGRRERAAIAVHDDGLVLLLLERFARLDDLIRRHVARARDVPGRKRLLRPDVENEGVLVHQPNDILR